MIRYAGSLTFSVFIMLSFTSSAQDYKVEWGPTAKIKSGKHAKYQYLGESSESFYIYHNVTSVEEFSKDLHLKKIHNIEKKYYPMLSTSTNGHFSGYIVENKVNPTFKTFMHGSSASNDDITITQRKMDYDGNILREVPVAYMEAVIEFSIKKFYNDSLISILGYRSNQTNKDAIDFFLNSYKPNEEKVNSSVQYTKDYGGAKVEVSDFAMDRNGRYIVLVGVKPEKDAMKKYELLIFDQDGKLEIDQPLDLKEYDINRVSLKVSPQGSLLIAGTLFQKIEKKKSSILGFFLAEYNLTSHQFEGLSSIGFYTEILEKYPQDKKGNIDMYGWFEMEIVLSEEGEGYLIAEHRNIVYPELFTPLNNSPYAYHELLVIKFENSKLLDKMSMVPKAQNISGTSEHGVGYFATINNGNLLLIFNDHKDNRTLTSMRDIEILYSPRNMSNTILCEVSGEKLESKVVLGDAIELGVFFKPSKTFRKDDQIYLGMTNKKAARFGILKL